MCRPLEIDRTSVEKDRDHSSIVDSEYYIEHAYSTTSMAPSSSSSQSSRSRPQASRDLQRLPANLRNLERQEAPYISPYSPVPTRAQQGASTTIFSPQPTQPARSSTNPLLSGNFPTEYRAQTASMSTYSSSSQDSIYSSPAPQQYAVVTQGMMSNPASISEVSHQKRGCTI